MKIIWLCAGHLCVGLAVVGLVLPMLPTTPFLLLASFCYSRGSERYHTWLLNHRQFGPVITDWHNGQVIRPRVKAIAVCTMNLFIAYPVFFIRVPFLVKVFLVACALGVSWFILSRPSKAPAASSQTSDVA